MNTMMLMTRPAVKTIPTSQRLPSFSAVLWDMDGTLCATEPLHMQAIVHVGERIGCPVPEEVFHEALGVGHAHCHRVLTQRLGMNIPFAEWLQMTIDAYIEMAAQIKPRENSMQIVEALHARGIPQAVISNSPRAIVEANVKGFLRFFAHPEKIFSTIISVDDLTKGKPDPQGYLLAAQRLNTPIEQCLVVEDSPTGVDAGVAAGAFTLFWPEYATVDDLRSQPHLVIDGLDLLIA